MTDFVIDASVAAKWVIEEVGTSEALQLRQQARLLAPDLLLAECANILWKKIQRGELLKDEALLAIQILAGAEVELLSARSLCHAATQLSIELGHPAYDCLYLALAIERDCPFVTADKALLRKLGQSGESRFRGQAMSLNEAIST